MKTILLFLLRHIFSFVLVFAFFAYMGFHLILALFFALMTVVFSEIFFSVGDYLGNRFFRKEKQNDQTE